MANISITYPESGLVVSVSIINQTTGIEDFSGIASEILTTKNYVFNFAEVANTNYTAVLTVP